MTRNRNAAPSTQPAHTASAAPRADGRPPARGVAEPPARPPRRGRGLLRRLAPAALVALGLVAGASAQAALTATDASTDGAYTVSWTAIAGATGYQLKEDGTNVYQGRARSKSFTGKSAGSYVYTLTYCRYAPAPVSRTFCGLPSNFAALTVTVPEATATPAPAAPTLTVPATDTDGSYRVSWTRPTGATSYQLQEKTNSGSWGGAYSGANTSKSFTNKGTAVYAYRVKACAGAGNCSGWSSEGSVRVTRAASALSASPNPAPNGAYTVSWTASRLGSYVLKESVDGATASTVYTGTGRSKRFTGRAPGAYAYSLSVCFSLLGSQTCVEAGSLTVTVPRPPATPPAAPTLTVPATDTDGSYRVSWTRPSRATSYQLQEKTDNGSWGGAYSGANTSKSFTGKGTAVYAYRVKACAGAGNCSGWSTAKSVRVTRAASALSAAPNPAPYGDYTVRWTASSLASYTLKESIDGGAAKTVYTGAGRSKRFTGRAPGDYAYTLTVCFNLLGRPACVDVGPLSVTVPEPTGSISAAPSPCVFASGRSTCSTTVTWSTEKAAAPCVFVRNTRARFACSRNGSKTASGIGRAGATFVLKAGNTFASETLDSVTVRGVGKPTVNARFSPAKINPGGSSTLSWSSTDAARCTGSRPLGSAGPSGTKSFTPPSAGAFGVKVTCTGAGGSGSATATVTVVPEPVNAGPPAAPGEPTVAATSSSSLEVTWTAPASPGSAIGDYDVRYRKSGAAGWTNHAFTGTGTSTTIGGLNPYTAYEVAVRARNDSGYGEWSDEGAATTDDVLPDPPSAPTVSAAGATSLQVMWSAPASRGSAVSGYDVRYRKASVTGWTLHAFSGTGASTVIGNLEPNTPYRVQVRAKNLKGNGTWSGTGEGRTLADTNRPPVAKDDSAATLRGESVIVDVLRNDRDPDAGDTLTVASVTTPGSGSATINANGTVTYTPTASFLGPVTFRYTVSDGAATASATVSVEVARFIAVPNPSADGNYTVKWAALRGASRYLLLEDGTVAYLGTSRSRAFTNKARGSYVYTLKGCTSGIGGAPICRRDSGYGELRVPVGAPAPAAPTRLAAAPNPSADGSFRVSWSDSTGATRYELEQRIGSGVWSGAHKGTATHADLAGRAITGATPYGYRVRACDGAAAADCGAWSEELTVAVTGALWAKPNPSTNGAYTVYWTPSLTATSYRLDESVDDGVTWPNTFTVTGSERAFTGKADRTYTYRVRACHLLRLPVGARQICVPLIPTRTDAKLDVTVARRLAPPTLTVTPEVAPDGAYRVSWGISAGAASYVLQERTDGGSWSNVTGVSGRAKRYTGRAVAVYGYQVKACAVANDCGVWSPVKSVRVPPAVPTGLTAPETDADGGYTVRWKASTGADRYVLEENDGGGAWAVVAKQASDALTSRAVTKTADGAYAYRVKACKGDANCSAAGDAKNVAVLRGADAAGIDTPEVSTGRHTVRWSELFSGAGYTLKTSTDGGATWTDHATGTTRSKAFTNLAVNTYTYDVEGCITITAFNIGNVCLSAHDDYGWAYGTTRVPPAAPANLEATTPDASGNYTVSWDAATGADRYVLQESADGGTKWTPVTKQTSDAVDSRAVSKTAGGEFDYRVQACQGTANCGDWSAPIDVSVSTSPAPEVTPPTECRNGRYAVEWSAVVGATRYELQRRTGTGDWTFVHRNPGTSTTLALDAGTSYSLRARSCRTGAGCTDWGPVVTFVAPPCIGVPGGFAVAPMGPDDYTLEWNAVTNAARYELERSVNGGNWDNVHNATTRSKAYRNESNGTYRHRVRACPATGDCGAWAGTVSVTVPIPTPVPRNLRVSPPDAQGRHTVSWDPVSFGSGILYLLDQTHRDNLQRHIVAGTSKTFTAPTPGDYAYQVKACIGFSDCSDESLRVTVTVAARAHDWALEADYQEHTRRIHVSWKGTASYARYELRQSTRILVPVPPNTQTPTTPLTLTIQVGTGTSHVSLNPVGGTIYAYEIRGCNGIADCGDWSAPVNVTVRQLQEPFADPVALATTAADIAPGNLPYETGVTRAGDAYVNVPIVPAPGVASVAPRLSLDYGGGDRQAPSNAPGDSLGHGWRISGLSKIYRCVTNRGADVSSLALDATDALCLDGEPLVRVAGTNLAPGARYRTLRETFVRIELKGSSTESSWFEAVFPDGSVRQYGNTDDSRLTVAATGGQRQPLVWSVNRETDVHDNAMTYRYQEDEANAVRHPVRIDYGANADATIRFWYMGREDTTTVSTGTLNRRRHLLLHRVEVWLSDNEVREYRLASALAQGHRRLTGIQLCGHDERGGSPRCLDAFGVHWEVSDGAPRLARVSDPMGRDTRFEYGAITVSGTDDPAFDERPFGNPSGAVDGTEPLVAAADDVATAVQSRRVVTAVSRDNGIGGRHRTTYAYQGKGLRSTRNWGELGFHATRVTDSASGVVTYYQYRHDFPYLAEVSAVHQYEGIFVPAGTNILSRRETSYATEDIARTTGAGKFPYIDGQTEFLYEGGTQIGTARSTNVLSFDTNGLPTRAVRTTTVGHGPAPQARPPSGVWGSVHAYTPTDARRTTVETVDFTNRTASGRWLIGFPRRNETDYHEGDTTVAAGRTVTTAFTPHGDSLLVDTETRFPGDAEHRLLTDYGYDTRGNVISAEVSGANVAKREATATNFVSSRYPGTLTNALGHRETLTYDARFGAVKTLSDANGRVTRLSYDTFGRETRRTTPDGVAITTTYDDCNPCPTVGAATAVMTVATSSSIAPDTTRYLDELGRTIGTETVAFDGGGKRTQDIEYDAQGRVSRVSEPYHAGSSKHWTAYVYDIRDRVKKETRADGGSVTTAYTRSGNGVQATRTETVKEPGSSTTRTQTKVSRHNVLGELAETVDAQGATPAVTTAYTYDASGLLDTVTVDGARETDFDHDAAGNREAVESPNFGRVTFAHSALGELLTRTDAKKQATRYTHDRLGRLLTAVDGTGAAQRTSRWTYDPPNGKGFLHRRCRFAGANANCASVGEYRETFGYNKTSRVATRKTEISDGATPRSFTHSYGYLSDGRLSTVGYPSGLTVRRTYNARGYLSGIVNHTGGGALETYGARDAYGNVGKESYGNGVATTRTFEAGSGRPTGIQTQFKRTVDQVTTTTTLQDNGYAWRTNGILARRTASGGRAETFAYDGLNRLLTATAARNGTTLRTLTTGYGTDKLGNPGSMTSDVTADRDVTSMAYGPHTATAAPGPDALTSATVAGIANALRYDDAGNVTRYDRASGDDRFIAWDARNLPVSVTEGGSANTATPTARETFRYGPSSQRYHRQSTWREDGTQRTQETFYAGGGYEELSFSGTDTATVIQKAQVTDNVLHVRKSVTTGTGTSASTTTTAHFEYAHRDHLGSVEAISRLVDGALSVRHLGYDPYGSRRATDWSRSLTATEKATLAGTLRATTTRGFTGHEQLDRVGLIHMHGRIYDPVLGRYLSPDAAVSHPGFSQGWNGYAYVSNSPLSYTDPTGMVQAGPGCNVGGVMCLESGGGGFAETAVSYPVAPSEHRPTIVGLPDLRPSVGFIWGPRGAPGEDPFGSISSLLAGLANLVASGAGQASSDSFGGGTPTRADGVLRISSADRPSARPMGAANLRLRNRRQAAERARIAQTARNVGTVYVTRRRVAPGLPYHLALEFTPHNGKKDTISAFGVDEYERLVSRRRQEVEFGNETVGVVVGLGGIEGRELFERLKELDGNYNNSLAYSLLPWGPGRRYNSNGYIVGLLRAAGAQVDFLGRTYYGIGSPVPETAFRE